MIGFEIDKINDRSLIERLKNAPKKIEKNIKIALRNIGYLIQREARRRAPYRDGDLERSIEFKTGRKYVDILVPVNSRAGRYAKIMHEGKYNLGKKSSAKGGDVGRLYIKRAIDDNEDKIQEQFRTVFRGV